MALHTIVRSGSCESCRDYCEPGELCGNAGCPMIEHTRQQDPQQQQGQWFTTFTGRRFFPFAPEGCEISIVDIAHALSQCCRWGGHCKRFYSVGEHSLRVSLLVESYLQSAPARLRYAGALAGLLHDASEAYLVDVPRPIKRAPGFALYRETEERLQRVILTVHDLPDELPASVHRADEVLLITEARDLIATHSEGTHFTPQLFATHALPGVIAPMGDPPEIERRFLMHFRLLENKLRTSKVKP